MYSIPGDKKDCGDHQHSNDDFIGYDENKDINIVYLKYWIGLGSIQELRQNI